jgi:hypothetical protein
LPEGRVTSFETAAQSRMAATTSRAMESRVNTTLRR